MPGFGTLVSRRRVVPAVVAALCASAAGAQPEGGLYIAGAGFSFQVAAQRALSENAGGRRFFLLTLPPETTALSVSAMPAVTTLRNRVVSANGVMLVCQRDIDNGRINPTALTPGVVAVRGWPRQGGEPLPDGQRYFPNENPAQLPSANEALRQLRSTCA